MEAKAKTVTLENVCLEVHRLSGYTNRGQSLCDSIKSLVAQTRASALEDAEKEVENEHLVDPTVESEDQAYDNAINHAVAAIQELRSKDV